MKKTTEELIKMINQGRVKNFIAYINAKGVISEAVKKAVFKSKNQEIIKAYINHIYPSGPEFYNHQDLVARYGNRSTLCTYYDYHTFDTSGQIALIQRGEIRPFSYFVGSKPKLSKEAFAFLLREGRPQLVKYYLENCLEDEQIKELVATGNIRYIKYFTKIATSCELETVAAATKSMEDGDIKSEISEIKVLKPYLFVLG